MENNYNIQVIEPPHQITKLELYYAGIGGEENLLYGDELA